MATVQSPTTSEAPGILAARSSCRSATRTSSAAHAAKDDWGKRSPADGAVVLNAVADATLGEHGTPTACQTRPVLRAHTTWEPLEEVAGDCHVTLRTDRLAQRILADLIALLDQRLG